MAGGIDISPGGVHVGWIGNAPFWDTSGGTGAWLKKCWIGGTNTSNAPFVADSSGNLSLNGTLNVNDTAVIGPTSIYGTASSEHSTFGTTLYSPQIRADVFRVGTGRTLGATEDVTVAISGGGVWRLHFQGGIYIGHTVVG